MSWMRAETERYMCSVVFCSSDLSPKSGIYSRPPDIKYLFPGHQVKKPDKIHNFQTSKCIFRHAAMFSERGSQVAKTLAYRVSVSGGRLTVFQRVPG